MFRNLCATPWLKNKNENNLLTRRKERPLLLIQIPKANLIKSHMVMSFFEHFFISILFMRTKFLKHNFFVKSYFIRFHWNNGTERKDEWMDVFHVQIIRCDGIRNRIIGQFLNQCNM